MASNYRNSIGELIHKYSDWIAQHPKITQHQKRMLFAIGKCRTAALGAHELVCTDCGTVQYAYNSCRNRNCPQCQNRKREDWLTARTADLLPVPYFHMVFTLPSELNKLCLHHPKVMYGLLFEAVWYTVNKLGKDRKWLGAQVGMTAILHSWGSNLSLHPHLHCMVPAGGLDARGNWKSSKSKGKYLFNRGVMGKIFRARYVKLLRKAVAKGLVPPPEDSLFKTLFSKEWITYAKRPFLGPQQVLNYIGRYSHKIAITNHRIQKVDDKDVYFDYKNYRKGGKVEPIKLRHQEFIRRFAMHIVPHKFVRIRHYGILSSRNKTEALAKARRSLGVIQTLEVPTPPKPQLAWNEYPHYCSCCKKVTVHQLLSVIPPSGIKQNVQQAACRGSPQPKQVPRVS